MKVILNQLEEKNRVLRLIGTDYEQGFQHGTLTAGLIKKNLTDMKKWVHDLYGGKEDVLWQYYADALNFLQTRRPEVMDELKGISEGAQIPFQDILFLNVQIYFTLKWIVPECSQFCSILKEETGRKTYTGKNRDNSAGPRETVVLCREYPNGLKMIEVGFAGIVTGPGNVLTSRGISITSSGVWSERLPVNPEDFKNGEALPDTHRLAKNISSIDEAESYLEELPRASGMNYIVAQTGRAKLFSLSARDVKVRETGKNICATNHYPFEEWSDLSQRENEYPSTHYRYRRILQLMEAAHSEKDFWSILSDHKEFPQNSICRHRQQGKGATTTYGALSIIEDEIMYVAFGNPCQIPASQIHDGITLEF